MAERRRPRAPSRGGSGRRRSGWLERAGRWLTAVVAAACLAAAVAVDSDPVGSFVAGVDGFGGDGGGSVGYLAPVSAKLAGAGVITASHHIRSDGSCSYGRWSDGSCRACPSGQVWRTGRGCVRAESRTSCSSGNTYFSQWRGCRPSSCPHGRSTSTGLCRLAPVTTTSAVATTTRPTTTTAAATTTTVRPAATTTTAPLLARTDSGRMGLAGLVRNSTSTMMGISV